MRCSDLAYKQYTFNKAGKKFIRKVKRAITLSLEIVVKMIHVRRSLF